jgi:LemA protein
MDIVIFFILAALLVWAIVIYNRLVRDRNRVLAAWSDIDVQLKRRRDLIPKLIEAVKHYAGYERATLTAVTELRARAAGAERPAELGRLETELGLGIRRLIAVAESYPELKASENFTALQRDISDVEDHIQYARRYYNGTVRNLNTRIDSFPDLAVARLFGYRLAEYFELGDAASGEAAG